MNEEEIKELFNKYCVKDLKDKNGQSECYFCKNTKHRYSLTWTSFLYEYKDHYYCYDCLLGILLQEENKTYKDKEDRLREELLIWGEVMNPKLQNKLLQILNDKAVE